jgi:Endoribonuclease YbeY
VTIPKAVHRPPNRGNFTLYSGVTLAEELALLVTHGTLHLVGYDDRDPVEADLMHRRERAILEAAHPRLSRRLWRGLLPPALIRDVSVADAGRRIGNAKTAAGSRCPE